MGPSASGTGINPCSSYIIIIIKSAEITIFDSKFINNIGKTAGAIYLQYSFVEIKNSLFLNNSNVFFLLSKEKVGGSEEMIADIFLDNFNAPSSEIDYFFYLNSSNFSFTVGISIYSVNTNFIDISFCEFSPQKSMFFSQSLKFIEIFELSLKNCYFSNFSADSGSALYIFSEIIEESSLEISFNFFRNCEASLGGVFYIYGD